MAARRAQKRFILSGTETLLAASIDDPFYVICGTGQSQSFPPLHHEYTMQNLRDGCHVCFYMIGVGQGGFKVQMKRGELVAEGTKEKDFEHEDGTKTKFRYRMFGPPNNLYDHSAMKAEIKNGLLRIFLPRRDQNNFIPRE